MRRLFGWLAGLVGIAALARLLARRKPVAPAPPPSSLEPDPATELRRKLSQSRADVPSPPPIPPPASTSRPTPPAPEPERESLEDRRARVHAKALEAIDEMNEPKT